MTYEQISQRLERENISLASTKKRMFALFIDEMILSALFLVIYWDKFQGVTTYEQTVAMMSVLFVQMVALRAVYQVFFVWYYGATPGKIAMKIMCVDVRILDKPSFGVSLLRAAVRAISDQSFLLGFAWAFGNVARQTWHDKLAKTVVIDVE